MENIKHELITFLINKTNKLFNFKERKQYRKYYDEIKNGQISAAKIEYFSVFLGLLEKIFYFNNTYTSGIHSRPCKKGISVVSIYDSKLEVHVYGYADDTIEIKIFRLNGNKMNSEICFPDLAKVTDEYDLYIINMIYDHIRKKMCELLKQYYYKPHVLIEEDEYIQYL